MITKNALTSLALSAAILGYAAPAFAINEYMPSWYIGIRGAAGFMDGTDLGTNVDPATNLDVGYNAGATFGVGLPQAFVQPLSNLRFEVEASRYWQHIDNGLTNIIVPLSSDSEREFTVTAYMANAYYFLPTGTVFTPYIGGGFGKATVELEADPNTVGSVDEEDKVSAWQGMVGFAVGANNPDATAEWNLGYRYFSADKPEFTNGAGGKTAVDQPIHSLELGVRWHF